MTLPRQARSDDILILGVGNPLLGDDGAGIRAIEMLAERDLPPNVELQEAGTPGWGLPSWLDGRSSVILVDAVQMGHRQRFCFWILLWNFAWRTSGDCLILVLYHRKKNIERT